MRNRNNPGNKCRYLWRKNCRSLCPAKWNPSAERRVQTDCMVLTNGFVFIKNHAATSAACRHNKGCDDFGSRTSKWNPLPCCRKFIFFVRPKKDGFQLYKKLELKNCTVTSTVSTPTGSFCCRLAAKLRLRRTHKRHGCGETHYPNRQSVTSPACRFFLARSYCWLCQPSGDYVRPDAGKHHS